MLGKQMTRMPFHASLEMAITKMNSLVMIKTLDMLKITVFGLFPCFLFFKKNKLFLDNYCEMIPCRHNRNSTLSFMITFLYLTCPLFRPTLKSNDNRSGSFDHRVYSKLEDVPQSSHGVNYIAIEMASFSLHQMCKT
jgi:hypothetical protein